MLWALCLSVFFGVHIPGTAEAQCGKKADMLIVLDQSGSMSSNNKWGDAKGAVSTLVNTYAGQIRFGLLLFPYPNSCNVTGVQVAVGDNTQSAIINTLNGTSPTGMTPMGAALGQASGYLNYPGTTRFVLLITDGCETCSGNGLAAVNTLMSQGVKTFVVGFGSGVTQCGGDLNAMATAGGTALPGSTKYYQASNQSQLTAALKNIAALVNCCGNGQLDPGENCDTGIPAGPGACPSSCNDGNACTIDQLAGTKCATQCQYTTITGYINGDGCCPPGGNSQLDSDCKIICGNGLLELGEQCDPGIIVGPGKCPTPADCDDMNVCTADKVGGSGCNRHCVNTPLQPSLGKSDGCCPAGASSLTDVDCAAKCGNGLLEAGETCDPGIKIGAGRCPSTADCADGNSCTKDTLTGGACTLKCANTPVKPNATAKDGCCPSGANSLTDRDCPVVCGNGVLEAGELCDIKIASGSGKCPTLTDCDDKNTCTKDKLTGSLCTVKCVNTTLTANPTAKDGCCPSGANSLTDKDCPVCCGNGVLEAGETCDPKITKGKGKCPTLTDCDDKNKCTKDALSGGACNLKCVNTKIKASPTAKDGCCPAGANSLTDKDCPPVCGNGVLEAGETCDHKITKGTGVCKTLSDCDDKDNCTIDALMGTACNVSCKNTKRSANASVKDGCCPPGNSSKTDADCPPPCGPDKTKNCIDLCKGKTCPPGYYCKDGKCYKGGSSAKDGGGAKSTGDGGGSGGDAGGSGGSDGGGSKVADSGDSTEPAGDRGNAGSNREAGVHPGAAPGGELLDAQGCACRAGQGSPGALPVLFVLGLLVLAARRRQG